MRSKKIPMIVAAIFAVTTIIFSVLTFTGNDGFVYPSLITLAFAIIFLLWVLIQMRKEKPRD